MNRLKDKVAIVTGAASGMGEATVKAYEELKWPFEETI